MIQDIEITAEYLTGLLEWSQPQVIKRAGAFKHRFIAEPNADLEWLWHHRRAELIALGVDRAPRTDNVRLVIWWKDAPELKDKTAELIKASSALDADISVSVPAGMTLRGYQKACVAFARGKRSLLIADSPGVGKTPEMIAIINDHPEWKTGLIVCKNVGKINWLRELRRWLTGKFSVWIAEPGMFPQRDIVIINYNLLGKFRAQMERDWDFVVLDEAHSIKNKRTQQYKNVMNLQRFARNRFALTGTPVVNEAHDVFPIISWLDPITYDNEVRFVHMYGETRRLHNQLRTNIMIRRRKEEVLTELPPIEHRIVEFDSPEARMAMDESECWKERKTKIDELEKVAERAATNKDPESFRKAMEQIDDVWKVAFKEMSAFRLKTGEAKFPFCMEYLKAAMEESDKIVVFGHHRHILENAHAQIPGSVLLYGGMHNNDKQLAIDRFQNDPNVPVFFGSSSAADTITLTASSRVIHFELEWTPAEMEQRISRCHRQGQKDSVLSEYLVLQNSCDGKFAKRLTMKMSLTADVLDRK